MRIPLVVGLAWCALPFASAAAAGPVVSDVPPDPDLGAPPPIAAEELDGLASRWEGDMLVTPDGLPADAFAALGREPQHAMAYEPTVGILYLAMEGVALSPTCGNGDSANAALNCSPLVDADTNFPSFGNGSAQAALYQELLGFYEDFNLVISTQRPPEYLPYTMAVVGGSAGLAGQPPGVCGVANVACDGLKRNHVSLTFPESCGGVAEIAAQETSHNWGLEHVNDGGDLMYPFNDGGFKTFKNECNAIDHSTGGDTTVCDYVHEVYCPAGGGEQQNSHAELMGVFGPREEDTTAPEIIEILPADGTTLVEGDSILPTATVSENSNFLGARWSVLESPIPDDLDDLTKCTNNVCDYDYPVGTGFDPNEVAWDFVNIAGAPAGTYTFKFEVMDGYGLSDEATITIEVMAGEDSGPDDGSDGATDPTGDGTDPDDEGDGTGLDGDDDDGGDDGDDDGTGSDTLPADGEGGSTDRGCTCGAHGGASAPAWLVLLVGAAIRRRRT